MTALFSEPGRHHAIWKEWRRIGKGQDERFFLEHRAAVLESLEGARPPEQVLLSRQLFDSDPKGWERKARAATAVRWFIMEGKALDEVASVPANSGLCGVYRPAQAVWEELLEQRLLLVLWDLTDPGNLGTLIRAAAALGQSSLLCLGGCRAWAAKVARSSAGALLYARLLQLPLGEGSEALQRLRAAGYGLHAAYPRATRALQQVEWTEQSAILLGNETRGLPEELAEQTTPFRIPMAENSESLNVAMAGSIALWEWRRVHL